MSKFFIPYVRHNDIPCVRHNLLEKACHQKSEKPDLHVLKIGKFSALDFYDVQLASKKKRELKFDLM
jgi:hypothetical protein